MFVWEKEAPCSRRIDVVFSSRSLYIHSFSERFRRRCGCCRVCASVFLSVLLIASVLCVVVLGWFSLRLKRDLDFMRRRLSKGKSWFFWSRASGLFISFRPYQRRCWRCTVWVFLLYYILILYFTGNPFVIVLFRSSYKVSVLTVIFFKLRSDFVKFPQS